MRPDGSGPPFDGMETSGSMPPKLCARLKAGAATSRQAAASEAQIP
jgi:hypothetical protein